MRGRIRTVLIACWVTVCWAQPPPAELSEGYAGSEMCSFCHEDISAAFSASPHGVIESVAKGRWEARGCEACHGTGGEHSETMEPENILGFKSEFADGENRACLTCHQGDSTHRGRLVGSHNRNSLSCLECHSVHQPAARPLLAAGSDQLCTSCHAGERADFNRPFSHRLKEKAIQCVDCHNPHGRSSPSSVRRVAANEPGCLACHADKRGPFPFEHAPVKLDKCTVCHEAHGSANPRMLIRHEVSQLCLECHAGSLSTLGGLTPGFHDLRSARFQNCTVCHSKTHGSFVSRDFLK